MELDSGTEPRSVTRDQLSSIRRVLGVPIDDRDLPRVADELGAQLALSDRLDELELDYRRSARLAASRD